MNANLGSIDRVLRLILGVALIAAALLSGWTVFESVALTWVVTVVGIVLIATALFRFCPLYRLLGVKTCRI